MDAVAPPHPGVVAGHRLWPLTERILARLPGSRPLWVAPWALVPWLNAGLNVLVLGEGTSAVWEQSTTLVVLNYAALSFAVAMTLWGAGRIARRLEGLQAAMVDVPAGDAASAFRAMNSVAGPVVASAVTAGAFGAAAVARDGWASGAVRGATWLLLGIAFWSFVWTYASLQFGLDRLGRQHLLADAPRVTDPAVALRPFGDAAFMGLWMLLAWLVPVVLTGLPDVVGFVIGMSLLAGALAAFFLSLAGLHRQIVRLKAAQLELARGLFAQAYAPVRATPTLEVLEQQRNLLGAADALEKRAHAIHEWPVDEGTFARVLTVATSVIAMAVGRLLLDPLGL